MGRAVNLQLWDENLQLWDFYHAFPRKLQMVLSVCLQQLVTSNVQLSLLPLSVKLLGSGVSASESEVAGSFTERRRLAVPIGGEQLDQVTERKPLGSKS